MKQKSSYINGDYCKKINDKISVIDKFSLEKIAEVSLATSQNIEDSINSSTKAFKVFSKLSAGQRCELLENFLTIFKSKEKQLIDLIVSEAGKPISYARGEFSRCVETIRFAIEESRRIGGEVVPMDFGSSTGRRAFSSKFPVGPIIAISPFNFPLNLALHKIAPALACGCTVTLKPSPYTPLVSLILGEIAKEAGYADGVLNIVVCSDENSEVLVKDERFKLLSFTGSPKVGWLLKSIAGKKKVVLELGGNAAVIIDDSCDLKVAAREVAKGSFLYSGQICISTQRIYVSKNSFKEFKELFLEETKKIVTGDPRKEETIVGPIIDKKHVDRILNWIEDSQKGGASILCGGKLSDSHTTIISPTVIENHKENDLINREEVFGPVALVKSYDCDTEAIELVNDSRFGLQVGVFSNRLNFIKDCFSKIEAGGIIVNSIPGFRVDHMPYGGVKDSGLGREGVKFTINDMTEERLLVI